MQSSTLRSRGFWIGFFSLSIIAAIAAMKLMFMVEPGLSLNISFSREQALSSANTFQQQQFPEFTSERSAAAFIGDKNFQNYIELEAGGLDAFQELIPDIDALAYYWRVRNFTPGEKNELITVFTPQGSMAAFNYLIPDDMPGAALDEATARAIAEAGATNFMGERFMRYSTFETQETRQSTGRMDYTFTYEHDFLQPGDARIRLMLKVAGDQLIQINPIKHIPQDFELRFSEMRTLNNQISQLANGLMGALLGLVCLLGGGYWLYQRHQLQWRKALLPAAVVATGMAAAQLSGLPISWMNYNTATSAQSFIIQQVAQAGIIVVIVSLAFATIYAVAEGLTRHAFAGHPRLWSTFTPQAAASPEISGRILGAYAWTGLFLLYAIMFLLFSSRFLGWWQPASLNVDPNILASWRPALTPIFTALQAGTWEECFFRAIPLAFAALLDRHFRSGNKILGLMLIVQALIFAAAHANYPQLPGYSRLIELFVPALVFGLVYIRFGLAIGMITHFLYDLLLMSLPIFLANDASLWFDRTLVILAGTAPLLALGWAYYKQGSLTALPAQLFNGEQPAPEKNQSVAQDPSITSPPQGKTLIINNKVLIPLVALALSLIVAALILPSPVKWPQMEVGRAEVISIAEQAIAEQGAELEGEWHRTATIQAGTGAGFDYVWRESGLEEIQKLQGSYLNRPFWNVMWRHFDGPVENRTESWMVAISHDGEILQISHQIPEAREGATLTREEAEALALNWIAQLNWAEPMTLDIKSGSEQSKPERSDWSFIFHDKQAYANEDARAAIIIQIAGDTINSYYRGIDVPESWIRDQNEILSGLQIYRIAFGLLVLLIIGCALTPFFRKHSGRNFSIKVALPWIGIAVIPFLLLSYLRIDTQLGALLPTAPWDTQIAILIGGMLLAASAISILIFFVAQAVHAERPANSGAFKQELISGCAFALLYLGLQALLSLLFTSNEPTAASLADYMTAQPLLAAVLNGVEDLSSIIAVLLLGIGLSRFINSTTRQYLLAGLVFLFWVSSSLANRELIVGMRDTLLQILPILLVFVLIRAQQLGVALAFLGSISCIKQLSITTAVYPNALLHGIISFLCCAVVLVLMLKHWYKNSTAGKIDDDSEAPLSNTI